jgi:SAM-dependent methyltransferase
MAGGTGATGYTLEDMNRSRFSLLAHQLLVYAAPIAETTIEELLSLLPLHAASSAVDIGCGKARLLGQLVERFGLQATGVDLDAEALALARGGVGASATLIQQSAIEFQPSERFDLSMCIGSSHALGGLSPTLVRLQELTKPGGLILLGEGYWKKEPEQDYLDAFGGSRDALLSFWATVQCALSTGLSPVWTAVSSERDWDHYEGLYRFAMSRFLIEHPTDPEFEAFRQRSESWYRAYLRWGRETMGFALFLFQTSGSC